VSGPDRLKAFHLGLLGHPLSHSRSPEIFHAALSAAGLVGEFRLYPLEPDKGSSGLQALLQRIRLGELDGLAVTIPYKEAVLPLVDSLTEAAEGIGAINVLSLADGRVIGDNTDAGGFLADLQAWWHGSAPPGEKNALVLGAGGAARAIAYGLRNTGWEVSIAARRMAQAASILERLYPEGDRTKRILPLPLPSPCPEGISLLVNATPIGMSPDTGSSPWPEDLPYPAGAWVYDLVYNPEATLFLQRARRAGLPTRSGLGMLVEQAALAFEIWTGASAPRPAMRSAVGLDR